MLVNGDPIDRARVQPGDALLLPSNVLFFVVARRRVLPKLAYFSFVDLPRFGEMDRFGIVGESPAAWELREMAARASGHATPHATIGDDLQDRREDVPLVVRHVLRELATTNPSLVSRFCTESGEVRMAGTLMVNLLRDTTLRTVPHLERLLWGAISESTDDVIAHNPEARSIPAGPRSETLPAVDPSSERVREALESCHGSVAKTARLLGLRTRYDLYRLLKKYRLEAIPRHDD